MTVRVVVLASGSGTNLQALINATKSNVLTAEIAAVVSDQEEAGAIARARAASIPVSIVRKYPDESRAMYDTRLAQCVKDHGADIVVLAGFMRLLSMAFLSHFPMRVINLHPALPGQFPGTHAIERAFAERETQSRISSGVMVHFVPNEGVDNGPVIATREVTLLASDTFQSFSERMHEAEHELIVSAVQSVINDISRTHHNHKESMS